MWPNPSLNRTPRWRRLRAARSAPVSLVRWASAMASSVSYGARFSDLLESDADSLVARMDEVLG